MQRLALCGYLIVFCPCGIAEDRFCYFDLIRFATEIFEYYSQSLFRLLNLISWFDVVRSAFSERVVAQSASIRLYVWFWPALELNGSVRFGSVHPVRSSSKNNNRR